MAHDEKGRGIQVQDVKVQAHGRWLSIFAALAPELEAALVRLGRHTGCPVHGGRNGFRLFKDAAQSGGGICNTCGGFSDGIALLQWLKGWSFRETLEEVHRALNGEQPGPRTQARIRAVPPSAPPELPDEKAREILNRNWKEAVPLTAREAAPARHYLVQRGLKGLDLGSLVDLRFAPRLFYKGDPDAGEQSRYLAGLLALVRAADGTPVSVHRTYLARDGRKAAVATPKKLFPAPANGPGLTGGAIRLGPACDVLAIAEGIETALSAYLVTKVPCWSAVNATLLAAWEPPEGVTRVHIYADRDRNEAGFKAAKALKARLWERGIKALIWMPGMPLPEGEKSLDWNDVLNMGGRFPSCKLGSPLSREG